MANMFGGNILNGGMFGNNQQSAMDKMRQDLEMQQMRYAKMQQAAQQQQGSSSLLDDFKNTISGLTQDEQSYLMQIPEFTQAKQIYEAGFMDFLGSKHANEYLSTPVGKQAIENLTDVAKKTVKNIKDAARERNQRLEALARLAEEDPEIQKKLQEKINNG